MQYHRIQETGTGIFQHQKVVLNERDLIRVANFIGNEAGIQLPVAKRALVENRLRKRLCILGFNTFKSYLDYTLESIDGEPEKVQLIDILTTSKTDFYREPEQFSYLIKSVVPKLEQIRKMEAHRELNIWSAGCSTGEEAYTLSILLSEIKSKLDNFKFNILATDISQSCLNKGILGIYTEKQIAPIPLQLRRKYLLRSRNIQDKFVQMGPELRHHIQFKYFNLMDKEFTLANKMDIIFCRNVMIYFNKKLREELVSKFEKQLVKGGYLFVGHSETLNGIETTLKNVAPKIYKKY
jgi:chemotaxis protein methyltransferase CheR